MMSMFYFRAELNDVLYLLTQTYFKVENLSKSTYHLLDKKVMAPDGPVFGNTGGGPMTLHKVPVPLLNKFVYVTIGKLPGAWLLILLLNSYVAAFLLDSFI